jgi:hypothetical protein
MQRQRVDTVAQMPVVIMDSIGRISPEDAGAIVIAASHGGKSSAEIALAVPLAAVFFNDAGVGKDKAGLAGLEVLQDKGVAAVTVGHDTACIGDPVDMWEEGIVTFVNDRAAAAGVAKGQPLREAVRRLSALSS